MQDIKTLPDLRVIIENITVAFFQLAIFAGFVIFSIIDGFVDQYEDATGIDAGASTGEAYDAGNDWYNPAHTALVNAITYIDEDDVFVVYGAVGAAERQAQGFTPAAVLTCYSVSLKINKVLAVADDLIVRIETDAAGAPSGALVNANATKTLTAAAIVSGAYNEFIFPATFNLAAGTLYWIVIARSGARDLTNYFNVTGKDLGAYAGGHAARCNNGAWADTSPTDLNFYVRILTYENMSLVSNAVVATAAPNTARIILLEQDIDAIILNTNLIAYASRDNGATWTAMALADEGIFAGTMRVLSSGAISIAAQPVGVNMRYRLDTSNNLNLIIKGVSLQWA